MVYTIDWDNIQSVGNPTDNQFHCRINVTLVNMFPTFTAQTEVMLIWWLLLYPLALQIYPHRVHGEMELVQKDL